MIGIYFNISPHGWGLGAACFWPLGAVAAWRKKQEPEPLQKNRCQNRSRKMFADPVPAPGRKKAWGNFSVSGSGSCFFGAAPAYLEHLLPTNYMKSKIICWSSKTAYFTKWEKLHNFRMIFVFQEPQNFGDPCSCFLGSGSGARFFFSSGSGSPALASSLS